MKIIRLLILLLFFNVVVVTAQDNRLFTLFPIPLKSSKLTVKRSDTNPESINITTVELRNLIGKKLQSIVFKQNIQEVVFENMDTYPNGIYVVLAVNATGKIIETAKFFIVN